MNRLDKLSKKLDLNVETISGIILYNHELNNFISKKQLKKIKLNIPIKSMKLVNKIAKEIKVDSDAVIGYILRDYINTLDNKKRL